MVPAALTIAGSDPSGGAGIQADLKTFHQFGVYGEAAITLLTVQNTHHVSRVELIDPDLIREQVMAVISDIRPAAAKTGAIGGRAQIEAIAELAAQFDFPLVVDPVMIGKHGTRLLATEAEAELREKLLPKCTLVTPNIAEAESLSGLQISGFASAEEAARRIGGLGARAVLVKGGHLNGAPVDILWTSDGIEHFAGTRIETRHTHGTGCTYSAAITAELAHGLPLGEAIASAKAFIQKALETAPGLGSGAGPVNHFSEARRAAAPAR
jgi:hydroxymethylpyrimidine/phosphomethylpyrimidine kinase